MLSGPDVNLSDSGRLLLNLSSLLAESIISIFIDKSNLISDGSQTHIRVILPQNQPVLCPGRHHPIRFMILLRHQIVDENADICLRTIQNHRLLSLTFSRRIDAGDQPLSRRLLITGTSVKLSPAEKSADLLKLQGQLELVGIDTIILDGIGIADDLHMLQPLHSPVHGILYILRQGTAHTTHIHFIGILSFRLNKKLVTVLIRKSYHLILDGRTVPWTGSLDHTGIQGRTVQVLPDDPVGLLVGVGQPTGDLLSFYVLLRIGETERDDRLIPELFLHN